MEGLELRDLLWPAVVVIVFLVSLRYPIVGTILKGLVDAIRPKAQPTPEDGDVTGRLKHYIQLAKVIASKTDNPADDKVLSILEGLVDTLPPLLSKE